MVTFTGTPVALAAKPFTTTGIASLIGVNDEGAIKRSYIGGGVSLKNFGSPATGNDWTLVWQNAVDSGETIIVPRGTFILEGADVSAGNLREGICIIGESWSESILKLADGANNHLLAHSTINDVYLRNIILDANKANQGLGSGHNYRGFYLLGNCERISVEDMTVRNSVDHGFMLSAGGDPADRCGIDSVIKNLRVENSGSAAHISAGGAGGSGINGGDYSTSWISCYGTGNYLNGMKTQGKMFYCYSYLNGSGFETGFTTPEVKDAYYYGCVAYGNTGDGFRNQGQTDRITWIGGQSANNGQCGITLVNGIDKARIIGMDIVNNNQLNQTRANTVGRDGIFFGEGSQDPSEVIIDSCNIYDDQGTATQEYGIYFLGAPGGSVRITRTNIIKDNLLGSTYVSATATGGEIDIEPYDGCSGKYRNNTSVSVTGTLTDTSLMDRTIIARELPPRAIFRGKAVGTVTGTNGTKTIRLNVGGSGAVISSQAAGETQRWGVNFTILRQASTRVDVLYSAFEVGGTSGSGCFSLTTSLGTDLPISITGQLGNIADTITAELLDLTIE